jgi:DNA-directed RNA polymerase subunit L
VNGHYEPGNVKWANQVDQANNRRNSLLITINEETKTLAEWLGGSTRKGVRNCNYYAAHHRIRQGEDPAKVVVSFSRK